MRSTLALTLITGLWLPTPSAAARSCIRHAYEHMDVARLAVRSGGVDVEPPPALGDFDQLLNSDSGGRTVLFWNHDGDRRLAGKWFGERQPLEPTPIQREYIERISSTVLRTSCGYPVPYTPLLPGRYAYTGEHLGPKAGALVARHLTISADRQRVTLSFSASGRAYEAVYEVTCAYFDWDRDAPRACGPREAHDDAADLPPEPTVEPPRVGAPHPEPVEAPPPAAPRGCVLTSTPPHPLAPVVLGLALARRRRRLPP